MSVLLQISDTHFGTEQVPVMSALLKLHTELQPDLVVLSGDITQRARRVQFRAAGDFLKQLNPRRLLTIPGNHDIPLLNILLRVFAPYANYSSVFGNNLQPEFESADLLVVCVNTTRAKYHTDGEVSQQQIAHVAKRLAAANATQLKVVVTHQPVHVITEADRGNLLRGYDAAIAAWADAGVDLILGGHIHLPYVRPLQAASGALPRNVWAVQAGTALSSRVRGGTPNSVNVVRYANETDGPACAVEQWNFDAPAGMFRMVLETALALSPRV